MSNKEKRHFIKINSRYVESISSGEKNFEVRYNDRDYQVDDVLVMYEVDDEGKIKDNLLLRRVIYLLKDSDIEGLKPGWCVLGTAPVLKNSTEGFSEILQKFQQLKFEQKVTNTEENYNLTDKERAVVSQAKEKQSMRFLGMIKKSKRAVIVQKERLIIDNLRGMGLSDEVINMIVLFAFNKVDSTNLNENYIMKVANDFNFKRVKSAEEAAICLRNVKGRRKPKMDEKSNPSNMSSWSNQNYKNTTSNEKRVELEKEKQQLLQKLKLVRAVNVSGSEEEDVNIRNDLRKLDEELNKGTNIPEWHNPYYKNETTDEERKQFEDEINKRLESLNSLPTHEKQKELDETIVKKLLKIDSKLNEGSNTPKWSNPYYKDYTTKEEKEKLEETKRKYLEKIRDSK